MNKEDTFYKFVYLLKKFFVWIFSNLIWTIISFILPFAIIIPNTISTIKEILIKRRFSLEIINPSNIITVLSVVVLEIILIFIQRSIKKSQNLEKSLETCEEHIKNDKTETINTENNLEQKEKNTYYDNLDYYFEEYNKLLTIYKNGHGIMIDSFTLIINDIDSIQKFKREINIHDAQSDAILPKLSIMKKTKISDRFKKYGFWCKCINSDKLIQSVLESYWSDNENEIDEISQNDPKIIKWILKINTSSIKIGIPYKVVYVISIPKMFPIINGEFSENIANIKHTHGKYTSEFSSRHLIKNFSHTISFENGFSLQGIPNGKIKNQSSNRNIAFTNDNNIIYDKYMFSAQNIGENDIIEIEWHFKERKNKGENCV